MQITATSSVPALQPIGRTADENAPPAAEGGGATARATATPEVRLLNPQPVIDPALGIVVTEYFNHAGNLTSQYPTEKMLDSYRIYGENDTQENVRSSNPSIPAAAKPVQYTS